MLISLCLVEFGRRDVASMGCFPQSPIALPGKGSWHNLEGPRLRTMCVWLVHSTSGVSIFQLTCNVLRSSRAPTDAVRARWLGSKDSSSIIQHKVQLFHEPLQTRLGCFIDT
eukprot:6138642-Amphidinium_carterae.1